MNKDKLKKHHFWILLGLVPLLVLIAVLTVSSGVGAAIAAKQDQINKTKTDLASKSSPKPNKVLTVLEEQMGQLGRKRTDLWKENWDRQIGVVEEGKTRRQDP